MVVKSIVANSPWQLQQAMSGPQALRLLRDSEVLPNLILLDIMMVRVRLFFCCLWRDTEAARYERPRSCGADTREVFLITTRYSAKRYTCAQELRRFTFHILGSKTF